MNDFRSVVAEFLAFARNARVENPLFVTITFDNYYDLGRFMEQIKRNLEPFLYERIISKDVNLIQFTLNGIEFKLDVRK